MNSNKLINKIFEIPKILLCVYGWIALCLLTWEKYLFVSNIIFYSGLIHIIIWILTNDDALNNLTEGEKE